MSWKLKRPFTAIIAGPSSSGKTEFALSLIEEQTSVIDHQGGNDNEGAFTKIIWCHGVDQSKVFDRLRRLVPAAKLQIVEGFPSAEIRNGKLLRGSKPKLLILDDLLQEVEKDANFFDLFIKLSHHTNTSVIFITQNLYNPTCRSNSTILRNTTYFVISVTTQQFAVVRCLALSLFLKDKQVLLDAFDYLLDQPYTFIILDLHAQTLSCQRIRTGLFKKDSVFAFQRTSLKSTATTT